MAYRSDTRGVTSRRSSGARTYGIKVNHLPKGISPTDLANIFCHFGKLASHSIRNGDQESYAFVNFYSHSEATKAAADVNGMKIYGHRVTVKVQGGSDPLAEGHPCSVKVTKLPRATTEEELLSVFNFSGEVKVSSIKLNQCDGPFKYAYVNYTSYEDATRAEQELNGRRIRGNAVGVKVHGSTSISPSVATPIPRGYRLNGGAMPSSYRPSSSGLRSSATNPFSHPSARQEPVQVGLQPSRAMLSPFPYAPLGPLPQTAVFRPSPSRVPDQRSSSTIKISIHGDLFPDDLHDVFSQYGTIKEQPHIRQGEPKYAYINYSSPEEANTACKMLNNTQIQGIRVQVKVDMKQVVTRQECKPVACAPLVARLLTSKYQQEVERVVRPMQVAVKRMKSGNGINLWGDPTKLEGAEQCINFFVEKIGKEISHESFSLHCLYVPLFGRPEVVAKVSDIEDKLSVEFLITNCSQQPLGEVTIASLAPIISEKFNAGSLFVKTEVLTVSDISSILVPPAYATTDLVWEWEDDDSQGDYKSYPPGVCSKLNREFAASPKGTATLQVPTRAGTGEYLVDFASMTQTNLQTRTKRRIRFVSGSPSWLCMYKDDHDQFVPYSPRDAAEIEKMYQTQQPAILTINGRMYTFRFTPGDMQQINVRTHFERPIKRQAPSNTPAVHTLTIALQVRGLQAYLQIARDVLKQLLDNNVVSITCDLPPSSNSAFETSLLQTTSQCFVKATIAANKVKLTGVPGYTERVKLLIDEQALAHERSLLSSSSPEVKPPTYWERQTSRVELKSVSRGSKEWKEVEVLMHKTLPSARILELSRIQNLWIWEMYSFSKQRMSKKNGGAVNERKLFHGTREKPPEKIYNSEKGFDFRFASKGMWGEGTYFAVNASYSASGYAHNPLSGVKQLILAYVLTGETYRCGSQSGLKKPPPKPSGDGDYDSVSGNTNGSDIFIIYDHEKAYPAYLISFR